MPRLLRLAALLLTLAPAAQAQEATVLAEYWTNNGSLPPEYAWETSVSILADGKLTLTHCTGYETEGPACKTRRATVPTEALAAIITAAEASGLADKPAQETETPMVGGSLSGGRVLLEQGEVTLLSQPAEADAARVGSVLTAIRAAIPARFNRFLEE
ncbi:hypothetical protein [Tabrizicola aquatica]|uniref:hypothetical protein n=1 Tax=Tabrizicola aquatica TaxID=909926 RepID=UPI0011AEEE65|nr:hypothetical protein [Tabrizicola aquatica]